MGQSHHRSFDIEVYAPGCDAWLEVSSISWFSDYQSRRADIRYQGRRAEGHADRPHAQRVGTRGSAGVGRDRRELPRRRRQRRGARCAASVHARRRANRPAMSDLASRRADYESAGLDVGRCRPRPDDAMAAVVRAGVGSGLCRAERVRPVDRRRRGLAAVSLPVGPRRRQSWVLVLHQLRVRQERTADRRAAGGDVVHLAAVASTGARGRCGREAAGCRERRVLRVASTWVADRGMVVAAVPGVARPGDRWRSASPASRRPSPTSSRFRDPCTGADG